MIQMQSNETLGGMTDRLEAPVGDFEEWLLWTNR